MGVKHERIDAVTTTADAAEIRFERVGHRYESSDKRGFLALSNINTTIASRGEFITLIGETGSGKTTFVQHMNALLTPTEGRIDIFGVKIDKDTVKKGNVKRNPIRRRVGLVFQFPEYQLFEETVLKDVAFGPKNFGVAEKEALKRAEEAIRLVGLDESYFARSPFNLSGGEKKRVSIAGILAMEPDILILDEPTSGLDPAGREALLRVFWDIHVRLGKTVLLITHDMNTVYQYAKRVLVMRDGYLVYDGEAVPLFTEANMENWNLDMPDVYRVRKAIEARFKVELPAARTIEALSEAVAEVLG